MLTKKHIYIILTFIIAILSSCSVPRAFTTIDVLRPAEVTFRPEVKNVVIVMNTATQPENIGHVIFEYDREKYESLKFDSAAIFCTASLRENLEAKGFFNTVNLSPKNFNYSNNFYTVRTLDKQLVRTLCKQYNSDAVISLDHIYTEDKTGTWYNADYSVTAMDVTVRTTWTIHYPTENLKSDYIQFTDSFSWENTTTKELPLRYNALVDATILTGANIADRLVPYWEQQDRFFYTPKNNIMAQAMDSVVRRKWNSAIEIWKSVLNSDKVKVNLQFQAANNIAIAYEILQDYSNAIKYAKKAVFLYPNIITVNDVIANSIYDLTAYIAYLEKRQNEIKLLNKQLSEE